MRRTSKIKLVLTDEQKALLMTTLRDFNEVANSVSKLAFEEKVFSKFNLQKLCYYAIRKGSNLTSQMCIKAIAKVAGAYSDKRKRSSVHKIKPTGSMAYDARLYKLYTDKAIVSLATTSGRIKVPYVSGEYQRQLSNSGKICEAKLCFYRKNFFLHVSVDTEAPIAADIKDYLGVDQGIVNPAVDSEGTIYYPEHIVVKRQHYLRQREALQRVGTRSAKRKLKRVSGRERRYVNDCLNVISKQIVKQAKDTNRGIALEDLNGITARTTVRVRKAQRSKHVTWPHGRLRFMIDYKAALAGVPVKLVAAQYTSQRCFKCSHIAKANRRKQDEFKCRECGYANHADKNGAKNISFLATANVNTPMVAFDEVRGTPTFIKTVGVPLTENSYKLMPLGVSS